MDLLLHSNIHYILLLLQNIIRLIYFSRHALPLFTSLLNVVCAYDPVGYGVPFNHLLFTDSREPLVEVALQLLIVSLDHDFREPATDDSNEVKIQFLNICYFLSCIYIFCNGLVAIVLRHVYHICKCLYIAFTAMMDNFVACF